MRYKRNRSYARVEDGFLVFPNSSLLPIDTQCSYSTKSLYFHVSVPISTFSIPAMARPYPTNVTKLRTSCIS